MKLIEVPKAEKLKTLQQNSYFNDLPKNVLKSIAPHMLLREYERGDVLFWEGDPCSGLHIIESGSVKLFRLSPLRTIVRPRAPLTTDSRIVPQAETCTGSSAACPADVFNASTDVCRDSAGFCDVVSKHTRRHSTCGNK